jgi:hypothetical protein
MSQLSCVSRARASLHARRMRLNCFPGAEFAQVAALDLSDEAETQFGIEKIIVYFSTVDAFFS